MIVEPLSDTIVGHLAGAAAQSLAIAFAVRGVRDDGRLPLSHGIERFMRDHVTNEPATDEWRGMRWED